MNDNMAIVGLPVQPVLGIPSLCLKNGLPHA